MSAVAIGERILAEQDDLVKKLIEDDSDDAADPIVAAVGSVIAGQGTILREHLARALDRIEQLESRLAEVESRGFKYCGVYQKAQKYARGDVVTYSGSAFVAIKDAVPDNEIPNASGCWQMFVQRGRDASSRDRRGE